MTQWTIETTKDIVNQTLEKFFGAQKIAAQKIDSNYVRFWDATESFVLAGGKRLRPYLCVLAYQAFASDNPQKIISIATAQELFHQCLIIHDDIIDRDYLRYGVDNIAGHYQKVYRSAKIPLDTTNHLASGAALLAGDLLLSSAYSLINESSLAPTKKFMAQQQLHQAMFDVAGGELLDSEAVLLDIDKVNTIKIADSKTARYSFVTPLVTGAALGNASSKDQTRLNEYGKKLGIAYQLADDIIGVCGDESATGKSASSDIEESKRTYLLQKTLELADEPTRHYLLKTIGARSVHVDDVDKIRTIMIKNGALVAVQQLIDRHAKEATQLITGWDITPEAKLQFELLAKKVVDTSHRSIAGFS